MKNNVKMIGILLCVTCVILLLILVIRPLTNSKKNLIGNQEETHEIYNGTSARNKSESDSITESNILSKNLLQNTALACLNREPLPEGIAFQIMVKGKLFTTSGKADVLVEMGMKGNYGISTTHYGVMPKGYEKYGSIVSVVKEEPSKELEMRAGADLTGDVYINPDYPDVVYAYLSFSWFEDETPFCYRFVSDAIADDQCIYYNGRIYQNTFEEYDEIVKGVTFAGKLEYIGIDLVPQKDCETNNSNWCKTVYNAKSYECELYAADDDAIVYVKEIRYGNSKERWIKCRDVSSAN